MEQILSHCPLFRGIKEEDLEGMLGCLSARKETYASRDTICLNGDRMDEVGIIVEGEVLIVRDDLRGGERFLPILGRVMCSERPMAVFRMRSCLYRLNVPEIVRCCS